MAAITDLVRHIEHHTTMYNRLIYITHHTVRVGVHMKAAKLQYLVEKLQRVKILLTKAARAYHQANILHRRVLSHDQRITRSMRSEHHRSTLLLVNDIEVYKGILDMFVAYALKQMTEAGTFMDKVWHKLGRALS
jgi:hypothetical protein